MTGGAPNLEALVLVFAEAERAGEWVIVNQSFREGGRDNEEWIAGGGSVGGVDVSAKVAEGEMEVAVGVKVREREGMVVEEGMARREDESGF